jgi:hypothetical protein
MANNNSTEIANIWANPPVANSSRNAHGRVRICQGNFETTAANIETNGDTIRLCEIPSNAAIISFKIACDDLDSGTPTLDVDFGIYQRGSDSTGPGTVLDLDAYASLVDMGTAALALTEIVHEAAATNIDRVGGTVYQDGAVSDDPNVMYEIVATCTVKAATGVAGTIAYQILYVVD